MTQPFAPQDHLIKIPRRVKNASGAWETVYDDYLEVKFRLVMFREKYPHGRITTEEVCVDLDRGYARFKATIEDGEGGLATGYGTETRAGFADYVERSETRSLGRALAVMGFGTQFVGTDLSEGEHVCDAPVTATAAAAPDAAHDTGMSPPPVGEGGTPGAATPPATNGHTPAPPTDEGLAHPTLAHLEALEQLVTVQCGADLEELHGRIRHTLGLRQDASTAKRLMVRVMTMEQFMTIFQHFTKVAEQLAKGKGKETPGADTPLHVPASTAKAATPEAPPAVPSVATSSSPGSDPHDATELDRQRLRAEVAQWQLRISAQEIEHVIVHNPYSKARALLWQTRVDAPAATPMESAAD